MPGSINAQEATRLLNQASARLSQHLQLVQTAAHAWTLMFDDGGSYRIEWSEAWARLVLTAELGRPTAQGERAALNLALSYNAMWREVGNLRMARDGEGGDLLLIGEWDPEGGETKAIDAALVHFEGLRRRWSRVLMDAGASKEPASWPPQNLFERI